MNMCLCGCGQPPNEGKQFLHGHYSRTPAAKAMHERRRKPNPYANPSGICLCGCGQTTPLATRNAPKRGQSKGHPLRYLTGHHMRGKSGPRASRWKGGRWTSKLGYVHAYAPEHPAAGRDGYVLEHRLIAEKTLGRYLYAHESVHHVNHDKADNRPENLQVLSKREHAILHPLKSLTDYYAAQDRTEQLRQAGRKGAESRWGKRADDH